MRTRTTRGSAGPKPAYALGFALSACCLVLSGCGTRAVFLADAALAAAVDRAAFGAEIDRAGREHGLRVAVEWPQSNELEGSAVEALVAGRPEPVVFLSPYYSLFASEAAAGLQEPTAGAEPPRADGPVRASLLVVAYYGPQTDEPGLVRISYDGTSAFEEAGRRVGEWLFDAPGRRAALLTASAGTRERDDSESFRRAYEASTGLALDVRSFDAYPGREETRAATRDLLAAGATAVVVLLGPSTRYALEVLQAEAIPVGIRGPLVPGLEGLTLFVVEDSLSDGVAWIARHLRDAGTESVPRGVVLPSRLRWAAADR